MKEIYNLLKGRRRLNIYHSTSKHIQNCVENFVEFSTRCSVMDGIYSQTSQRFSEDFVGSLIFFEMSERTDNE